MRDNGRAVQWRACLYSCRAPPTATSPLPSKSSKGSAKSSSSRWGRWRARSKASSARLILKAATWRWCSTCQACWCSEACVCNLEYGNRQFVIKMMSKEEKKNKSKASLAVSPIPLALTGLEPVDVSVDVVSVLLFEISGESFGIGVEH